MKDVTVSSGMGGGGSAIQRSYLNSTYLRQLYLLKLPATNVIRHLVIITPRLSTLLLIKPQNCFNSDRLEDC